VTAPSVGDAATAVVRSGSVAALPALFVLAARACARAEARGDVRDGLADMPLPFRAAELLCGDADVAVASALSSLDGAAAELLGAFASRADRGDVGAMGWREEGEGERFRFVAAGRG
jgi:hypothetical protein